MGAEVVIGDLLDLDSMHRVIAGCFATAAALTVAARYVSEIDIPKYKVSHDVRDYEAEDGLDAGCPPQAFPERGGCVDAGGVGRACG